MAEKRIDIPAEVRAASVVPSSVNEEERTIEIVWTTGARVKRSTWFDGDFFEELSTDAKHVRMERLASGRAPFLADHASYSIRNVLGVITNARLSKGQGTATVRFAKDDPDADAAWNKVRQGILPNVSVGYRIHRLEKVEGGDDTTPVFRATDWEPHEVSLVTVGADAGATIRSESAALNTCTLIHTESRDMPNDNTPPSAPPSAPPAAPVDLDAVRAEAQRAERERVAEITTLTRRHGLDELGSKLVAEGVTVDAAREAVLNALADRDMETDTQSHVRMSVTDDSADKFRRGITAALIEKGGALSTMERAKDKGARGFERIELDAGEFRGLTLLDIARLSLERGGVRTRGMDRMTLAGLALTHRSGGMATTSDFAVLFEEALHKMLLGAYAVTPDTWSRFCKVDTVPDFRDSNRYRTGSFGVLDAVDEHGEFKNKAIPDGQKTAIRTGTKGNIIALTRQAIINDDMSALADLAQKLGRAARLSIETDVYALLAQNGGLGPTMSDSNPFFHASRGNVNGTASALSVAGIDADRVVMAKQQDISNNEYLDLRPEVLLVPIGLGGEARVVNDAQYEPTDNKFQKPNKVRGLFRDIVDTARLSGTRRYMFADPSVAPAIVVAFLEGQGQGPVLESQDGFRVDGTEWKVRIDYHAQVFDPKGAVTNAGTS